MYRQIEINTRGSLEINDIVVEQQVEYVVQNKAKGFNKIEVKADFHSENTLFILVKIYVESKESFHFNVEEANDLINQSIMNTLNYEPKKIAFAYIH